MRQRIIIMGREIKSLLDAQLFRPLPMFPLRNDQTWIILSRP